MTSIIDNIVASEIVKRLGETTPEETQQAILENKSLFEKVTDEEWEKHRSRLKMFPFVKLDYGAVVDALNKNRPDILAAITTTSGGVRWLHIQVDCGCQKLGMKPTTRFV
jgi:hypothetical protein